MKNKILITGTGRSGTSFLMQLFSNLKMETGFSPSQANSLVENKANAGLEILKLNNNIRIQKAPHFSERIPQIKKEYNIEHVIIPIRNLEDSAKSRGRIGGNGTVAGGLWKCKNINDQIVINSKLIYNLILDLVENDIKFTFLPFPNIIMNNNIIYEKLNWLFKEYNITKDQYLKVFNKVSNPTKIHIK